MGVGVVRCRAEHKEKLMKQFWIKHDVCLWRRADRVVRLSPGPDRTNQQPAEKKRYRLEPGVITINM